MADAKTHAWMLGLSTSGYLLLAPASHVAKIDTKHRPFSGAVKIGKGMTKS